MKILTMKISIITFTLKTNYESLFSHEKILQQSQLIESSSLGLVRSLAGKSPVTLNTLFASTVVGGTTFS